MRLAFYFSGCDFGACKRLQYPRNNLKTRPSRRNVVQTCFAQGGQTGAQRVIRVAATRQQLFEQIPKRPHLNALEGLGLLRAVLSSERSRAEVAEKRLLAAEQNVVGIQVAVHQRARADAARLRRCRGQWR